MMRKRIWVVILALPLVAAPRTLKPGWNLFSKQQDVQLGKEASAQVERQMQVVNNPELQNYVSSIGKRLVSSPEAGDFPYSFKVVNDTSVNAFALPGGPTYVFTGLIKSADNEAQLAGVLAHEVSHVALRHGTNQVTKANLIQLPALLASGVLGRGSLLGQLGQLGVGLGANSLLLSFSRSAERDADLLGTHLMAAAGYNPIEMARFFEKLEASGGSRGPQFLSDHPNPGNRVKAVEEEIRSLPQRSYNADTGQFKRMQAVVSTIPPPPKQRGHDTPGHDPRAGGPLPDIRPSKNFREYRSRAYTLSYPDNWSTFGDTDSAMVTIAPREALFQESDGRVQIGYGATVSYYHPQDDRADLRRDTAELIRQLQAGNPGMSVRGNRRARVGGQEALVTTLNSQSPYRGESEVDSLVTVARPEGLFYVIFIAPSSEWNLIQDTFERMLSSIRFS